MSADQRSLAKNERILGYLSIEHLQLEAIQPTQKGREPMGRMCVVLALLNTVAVQLSQGRLCVYAKEDFHKLALSASLIAAHLLTPSSTKGHRLFFVNLLQYQLH